MKQYSTPEIIITTVNDVITTSRGDSPLVDLEW